MDAVRPRMSPTAAGRWPPGSTASTCQSPRVFLERVAFSFCASGTRGEAVRETGGRTDRGARKIRAGSRSKGKGRYAEPSIGGWDGGFTARTTEPRQHAPDATFVGTDGRRRDVQAPPVTTESAAILSH